MNLKQKRNLPKLLNVGMLFLVLLSGNLFAQNVDSYSLARAQASKLKNGVLLVNLHTYTTTVTSLQQHGKQKEAEQLTLDLKQMNQDIMSSFKANFNYCKVYYFYSENTDAIITQKYDQFVFDGDFNSISAALIGASTVFIADFSSTDNSRNLSADPNNPLEKDKANDFTMSGLILRDNSMIQLNKPFPYYVRISDFETIIPKEKIDKAVKKLNKKLREF